MKDMFQVNNAARHRVSGSKKRAEFLRHVFKIYSHAEIRDLDGVSSH